MKDSTKVFCADRSVRGFEWVETVPPQFETPEGVSPLAAKVAAARGFDPARFFSPSLKTEMPDPSSLKGMDEAISAFCDAVENDRRILLYGDYDVDGATSVSLVLRWIRSVGKDALFYIPDRFAEGYGPNAAAIRKVKEEHDIEFILFLDSGTTAHDPLGVAQELGIEIVIIDHHEPDDRTPPGILVNPKRRDEDRSLDYLCTAGLAFLFLVGVQREMRRRGFFNEERPAVELLDFLGLAALGTVADMVPLIGLNRAYVARGLPRMDAIPGLRALNQANGEPGYTATACGFIFGPCINASGRIANTRKGTEILSSDDPDTVAEIARILVETNEERQRIQKEALEQAMERIDRNLDEKVVVLYDPSWHPGVVGLVASRLKDALDVPAVVIGQGGAGSCRSPEGFDIGSAVIAAREAGLLVKGGGHAGAAGLTVVPEKVDALREFLAERAKDFVHPPIRIDLLFKAGEATPAVAEALEAMEPFGMKNPKPRIAVVGGWVRQVTVMKGKHVKLFVSGAAGETECIMWNGIGTPVGDAAASSEGHYADVYGSLKIDAFGGKRRATVIIEDMMIGRMMDEAAA